MPEYKWIVRFIILSHIASWLLVPASCVKWTFDFLLRWCWLVIWSRGAVFAFNEGHVLRRASLCLLHASRGACRPVPCPTLAGSSSPTYPKSLNPNPPPSPVPCPQQKLNKVPSRSERTLNPFHRNCKLGLPPKTPFARPGLHPLPPPRGLFGISALAWGRASAGSCHGRSKVLASVAGSCAPAPAHSRRALHEVLGLRMF